MIIIRLPSRQKKRSNLVILNCLCLRCHLESMDPYNPAQIGIILFRFENSYADY